MEASARALLRSTFETGTLQPTSWWRSRHQPVAIWQEPKGPPLVMQMSASSSEFVHSEYYCFKYGILFIKLKQ